MKNKVVLFGGWLCFFLLTLLLITSITGCDSG